MKAKDFLGRDLSIGDSVVFCQLKYRNMMKGIIKRITAKMVIIEHTKTNSYSTESKQYHNQVIKI